MKHYLPTSGFAFKSTVRRSDGSAQESLTWIGSETKDAALTRWSEDNEQLAARVPSGIEHDRALVEIEDNEIIDVIATAVVRKAS